MKKVSTNCVISAETSKLDFIIVKEGVISVIPTTEPAFASARIIIEKFDNPNMLTFRIYEETVNASITINDHLRLKQGKYFKLNY